ncbi:MAG: tRNA pseudouridine(13) synthase TruD, partial [Planctomycetes bacterium]|nr:tRNA pseudouridine(13) synthase TruD [Planctomycetota bacterium]
MSKSGPSFESARNSSVGLQLSDIPFLTKDVPGTGGEWKGVPEDFVVEEIPAYLPCGDGEHLFLWIQKRDVSASDLIKHVGRSLKCPPGDIGVAGNKDRRAVTRQWISIPAKFESSVDSLNTDSILVLKSSRHRNKLRTGHLKGNRFTILIRDVVPDANSFALQTAQWIHQFGFPNFYGPQRFGHQGETLQLGIDLLLGRRKSSDIPESQRRFLRRLSLSAVQSELFNRTLADRMNDGLFSSVLSGDVMEVVASGGKFIVEDVAAEQPRYDAGETVVTGPIFGIKMKEPRGVPFDRELKV